MFLPGFDVVSTKPGGGTSPLIDPEHGTTGTTTWSALILHDAVLLS